MTEKVYAVLRRRDGFTLIELLVVVAIIALLISILLPSLSKARAQARTTLCASRISQLTKSVLIYADDFDEAPPFTSYVLYGPTATTPYNEFEELETWLGSLEDMQAIVTASVAGDVYPAADVDIPRSGTLFPYTRFEALYKCPEFERKPGKEQNVFNYTRACWARKFRPADSTADPGEPEVVDRGGFNLGDTGGPVLKISAVYAPAALPMFIDEQWNRHVAGAWGNGNDEAWIFCDPVFDVIDEMGQYHGPKIMPKYGSPDTDPPNPAIQSASLAHYDGHVNLRRDPAPSREEGAREVAVWSIPLYVDLFAELGFAQIGGSPWTGNL